MKNFRWIGTILFSGLIIYACSNSDREIDLTKRLYAGGETTSFSATSNAYSYPSTNLNAAELGEHLKGDLQFQAVYVKAPANVNAGLGPIFNTSSCISCHPKDGRAAFPEPISKRSGFLMRISVPGRDENGGPKPAPGYGLQIQNHAVFGFQAEADYAVRFETLTEVLADGTLVELRKPVITLINPYITLPEQMMLSPRIGTAMFGLGLLEFIPEEDILRLADPEDLDQDGISGRPNYVYDPVSKSTKLGRFGWKANVPSLEAQTAIAFIEDMGITSPVFPSEHEYEQHHAHLVKHPEISQEVLDQVVQYCRTLAVPAPRNQERKEIKRGAAIFHAIECAKCHVPEQKTGDAPIRALQNQVFYPYTDMLLHDMGEGLADHRPDYLASGREWRTRPLWGIGLTNRVNGHTHFLHDGRARNLKEAILWHGGEAENSKESFKKLSKSQRDDLIAFLNSL